MNIRRKDRGMSDYQVTNFGICGECKWHKLPEVERLVLFGRAWVCTNDRSDYVADFTDYTDTCEHFEQRGIEE